MNSNIVKPEIIHLNYHFTLPLNRLRFKFMGYEILSILLKMYVHKLSVISYMTNFQVAYFLSNISNLARTLLK